MENAIIYHLRSVMKRLLKELKTVFNKQLKQKWESSLFNNLCFKTMIYICIYICLVWFIEFNATFKNISVISWGSVLLVGETGVPGESHRPVASHWQTLSHNVISSTHRLNGIRTHNVSGIDCIGSYKSNYHTITTTPIANTLLRVVSLRMMRMIV